MYPGTYQEAAFGARAYNQGLFEQSSTQKCPLGLIRPLSDGRVFAYARAGAVALSPGLLTIAKAPVTNHVNQACAAIAAIGDKRISVTVGGTAAAANLYGEGMLTINAGTGLGYQYKIRGHAAFVGSDTQWVNLYDAIQVATDASTTKVCLNKHRQDSVVVLPSATAAATAALAGVPPIAVTALYYFWNQVKGQAAVLAHGTLVLGNLCYADWTASTGVAGAVIPASTLAMQIIGGEVGIVEYYHATAEYALVNLRIAGY